MTSIRFGKPVFFLESTRGIFYKSAMGDAYPARKDAPKMMLGFIVRRCAAELGHAPSPDEFATWANEQKQNGQNYCLFGKPISSYAAKVIISQPGRLVTVRAEGAATLGTGTNEFTTLRDAARPRARQK